MADLQPIQAADVSQSSSAKPVKPLGGPAYGSIPHLPGSKLGPGDHHIHEGQARICTERLRDDHDSVTITEKMDGTCVAVARLDGQIVPLIRRGYHARDSHFRQHHLFADWVDWNSEVFRDFLNEGERVCGEWMAQAHGIRYPRQYLGAPLYVFDLMDESGRKSRAEFDERWWGVLSLQGVCATPREIAFHPRKPDELAAVSGRTSYEPEGFVYRVERDGQFEFIAKWVRPDFEPGKYLESVTGRAPIWNFL